jgi:RimJ/RimL family protein N-acetyltransferase
MPRRAFAKLPRRIEEGGLSLRPAGPADLTFLASLWGRRVGRLSSWRLWWWVKRNFAPAYLIEWRSRRVGFLGLYDLELGDHASVSLYLHVEARRLGLGSRSLDLLRCHLGRECLVNQLTAEVAPENTASLAFLRKLGFRELGLAVGQKSLRLSARIPHDRT